jgi:hypothetical protein
MVFSDIRSEAPFVLDAERMRQMPVPLAAAEKEVLRRLDGAAFIRLWVDGDIRLSIGLLNDGSDRRPLPEPPIEMASVLAEHLESPVIELFLAILMRWAAYRAEYETRRRELMRITGEVCLSVGRDQSLSLQRLAQSSPSVSEDRNFERLQTKAVDLQAAGNLFLSLSRRGAANEQSRRQISEVALNTFIKSVWAEINNGTAGDTLSIDGDCGVRATPEDLSIVISSILQWLSQRFIDTPFGIEPRISVQCRYYDKGVEATFEDRSERLGKVLRDRLFYPFAESDGLDDARKSNLSLFLARILIEERYNGTLEDISDAVDAASDSGHRFRVRFPRPFMAKADNA